MKKNMKIILIIIGFIVIPMSVRADSMVMAPTQETQKELEQKVQKEIEKQVRDQNLVVVPKEAVKESVTKETVKPLIVKEEKHMVRDAITGEMVEQKSPFDDKIKEESLGDSVKKKFED